MKTWISEKGEQCSIRRLGQPKTVGALMRILSRYKPRRSFGFRNQPMQSLYELRHGKNVFVVFQ